MYKPITCKCEKCGYVRTVRVENPKKCPKCSHVVGTEIKTKKTTPPACKQDGVADNPLSEKRGSPR